MIAAIALTLSYSTTFAEETPSKVPFKVIKEQVTRSGVKHDDFNGRGRLVRTYTTFTRIRIIALVDDLTITGILLNRGHCENGIGISFPVTLKFGEALNDDLLFCDPIEIVTQTDQGNWTGTWSE